jgi:hypothetical protein
MSEPTIPSRPNKKRRIIYALSPLLLLLFGLGLINLIISDGASRGSIVVPTAVSATIISSQPGGGAVPATSAPLLATAMPSPAPTATATPLPALPPEARIQLLGPPDGSVLPAIFPISLFWAWPLELREGESLVVYLLLGEEERPLSALSEPNMGSSYQWQIQPADLAGLESEFRWQVRLESDFSAAALRTSDSRSLRLLSVP